MFTGFEPVNTSSASRLMGKYCASEYRLTFTFVSKRVYRIPGPISSRSP